MSGYIRREDRLFDPITRQLVGFVDLDGNEVLGSPVSGGGAVAPTAVTGADVLADIAPASPGTWPSLTTYYVSTAATGVDVGTLAVWVPTNHPTIPAARGWRYQFAPSATVV
jgi:hypothetical protein